MMWTLQDLLKSQLIGASQSKTPLRRLHRSRLASLCVCSTRAVAHVLGRAESKSFLIVIDSLSSPPGTSLLRASLRSMAAARHSLAVQNPQPRPQRRQQRRPREEAQLRAQQRAAAAALAAEPSRQAVAAVGRHQA